VEPTCLRQVTDPSPQGQVDRLTSEVDVPESADSTPNAMRIVVVLSVASFDDGGVAVCDDVLS